MSERTRVLLIEDEASIRMPLVDELLDAGYEVLEAADGELGLTMALREDPDLILLDLMLPGRDGFSVLRALRADRVVAPVIVLSARGEEWDRVQGFEVGADDYLVKPFSARELLLRIKALLLRSRGAAPGVAAGGLVRLGAATIDFGGYGVERGGVRQALSRRELDLLQYLLEREGRACSRDELLDQVWGLEADVTPRTVDQHVLKLRKKLEPDPDAPVHLLTIRGVGYQLVR
ncbi:response regulator transcription factor [Engelhardtia mirabilis]|uniref:Sensory transduction protein regX3 n=1 Tax=Engelhardtia mirabilis TaxID=2528011 RepID=A0A518BI65_9BACT|nr:Sensory transduction protein regX3 [Planctomycetes bacterium Pla133]QDV00997.1 Sensory transduction protein regX3 [Planctomycetes bacterium Pla86]